MSLSDKTQPLYTTEITLPCFVFKVFKKASLISRRNILISAFRFDNVRPEHPSLFMCNRRCPQRFTGRKRGQTHSIYLPLYAEDYPIYLPEAVLGYTCPPGFDDKNIQVINWQFTKHIPSIVSNYPPLRGCTQNLLLPCFYQGGARFASPVNSTD